MRSLRAGAVNKTGATPMVRAVIWISVAAIFLGLVSYGVSGEVVSRFLQNLSDRPGGTFGFRFLLQPAMATLAAYRDGVRDARLGEKPFLCSLLTDPTRRSGRVHEALGATARIILLGLAMDLAYQVIEFDTFHPIEAVAIAFLLALAPYLVLRGLVTRIVRRTPGHRPGGPVQ